MKEFKYDKPIFEEKVPTKGLVRSAGSEKVPPLRTYRSDVDEMMKNAPLTKTKVIMAEEERREERGEVRTNDHDESHMGRIILILLAVLIFGVGIGLYVLIGAKSSGTDDVVMVKKPNRQASEEITITDSPREQVMVDVSRAFNTTNLNAGKTRELVFVTKDADGTKRDATTREIFAATAINPLPDLLLHSLSETTAYGVYAGQKTVTGYLFIKTRSYPDTFAGMLDWEKHMSDDLTPMIHPEYRRAGLINLVGKPFSDERIGSDDVRILRDDAGITLIIYKVVDKATLLMAGNEEAFRGLKSSLVPETAI